MREPRFLPALPAIEEAVIRLNPWLAPAIGTYDIRYEVAIDTPVPPLHADGAARDQRIDQATGWCIAQLRGRVES